MIVRANVGGTVEWLDGTRLGDRSLDNLPSPVRWALPLTLKGSNLERIPPRDTRLPLLTEVSEIDATAGLDRDARVLLRSIVRGDEAFALRTKIASLSADDADRALKTYWQQQLDWLTPDKVSWTYDERRMAITLDVIGRGNPSWKGDVNEGRSLIILHAGFFPPNVLRRPADQDQSARWANEFPRFRCSVTTIRLPKPDSKFVWSLYADPMNQKLGGVTYWRASGLDHGVVRVVMSTHSSEPEVTPQEAAAVNAAIPDFNNNMSSVSEDKSQVDVPAKGATPLPFGDDVDWLNAPNPCFPHS